MNKFFLLILLLLAPYLAAQEGTAPAPVTPANGGQSNTSSPSNPGLLAPSVDDNGQFSLNIDFGEEEKGTSNAIKLLLLLTVLSVAPAFLIMMTSFTRVIIVLGFIRRALGTNTLPPNQAILGLALFMTMFIMAPTIQGIYDEAYRPYVAKEITEGVAVQRASDHIRLFMAKHTRKNDLAMFVNMSKMEKPKTINDVPFSTLIPAFITSELKTSFQMGFIIFLPFVIIDLVIAAILMALGMMMLPPVIISLPFKILLFVLIDGWALLTHSIVASYG